MQTQRGCNDWGRRYWGRRTLGRNATRTLRGEPPGQTLKHSGTGRSLEIAESLEQDNPWTFPTGRKQTRKAMLLAHWAARSRGRDATHLD
jgi:hypothetical protein